MEILRSPQNATIRRLISLRNNRRRRAAKRILVDGTREILLAIDAGLRLIGFYEPVSGEGTPVAEGDNWDKIRHHAELENLHHGVAQGLFRKLCYGEAIQRCVAEFEAPSDSFDDLGQLPPGLILVLDQVEKPGNLGAVFRTADATGVSAVLLSDCPSDRFNPNAIRGSLGAVFTVPSASGSQTEVASFLSNQVSTAFAMRVEGARPLFECSLHSSDEPGRVAVILGSEAEGLGQRWTELAGESIPGIMLPMAGRVDSLNISVTAAIVAFEAVRQRFDAKTAEFPE